MNGTGDVCLDASVFLSRFFHEVDSAAALSLIDSGTSGQGRIIGPAFLVAEVLSVVRGRAQRRLVGDDAAEGLIRGFLALPITLYGDPASYLLAWQIARRLALPVIYDTVYLAVAIQHEASYWTADRVFFDRAKEAYPAVRLLGVS